MFVVRYVTLMALVVWLGGLVTLRLFVAPSGQLPAQFELAGYGCGAVMLVGLIVLKFVGPPPQVVVLRLALVGLMLATAAYSDLRRQSSTTPSTTPMTIEIVLGLVLVSWYVRE